MVRNMLLAVMSVIMISTVSAQEMTKGGGYSFCKNELKSAHPTKRVDTKLLKVKYKPRNKSRQGITHQIDMRVSGIEDRAYKATCTVTRAGDEYTAIFSK